MNRWRSMSRRDGKITLISSAKDFDLTMNAKNIIDRACEQERSFKKNRNDKETLTWNQKKDS